MSSASPRNVVKKISLSYGYGAEISGDQGRKKSKELASKPKTILQQPKLSLVIPVIFDGVDVTPQFLNPFVYEGTRERQINIIESTKEPKDGMKEGSIIVSRSLSRMESQRFQASLLQQKQENETTMTARSYLQSPDDDLMFGAISVSKSVDFRQESFFDFDEDSEDEKSKPIPEHISLILTETETYFLLDLPSSSVLKATEEGEAAEEDNKLYEYLTKGKGKNRRTVGIGMQTVPILMKSRDTEAAKVKTVQGDASASVWDMYDTYKKEEEGSESEGVVDDEDLEEKEFGGLDEHKLGDDVSLDSYKMTSEEKQMINLVKNKKFLDALQVIERILSNNCYNEQQKRYKGLSDPYDLRDDIEYKYRLNLLWTFANKGTLDRCVTRIEFNPSTEDVVAVAYGKFYFLEQTSGLVMIWNIKNPTQPERRYKFAHPITSLQFSKSNPNLLAVGFYNGHIRIIDITKREIVVTREDTSSSFEPVWDLMWVIQGDEETLIACYGDGRVCRFYTTDFVKLKCIQIMRTAKPEGKLKGIKYLKPCEGKDIPISRYSAARCLTMHPADPSTYFICTSGGVIHRCSTNYYNQHMDLFKAHDGPVNCMKFSPFANKLFYTAGDDFRGRLWIEGVTEPLVISEPTILPILDMDWSPAHPTILASIRGQEIRIWDLQRKMYAAQSQFKSPSKSRNTVCKFAPSGRCLLIGDMAGDVHVFSLEDMPLLPFFPEDLIYQSLKRLLVTKPDLIRKLDKLGSLNFDRQHLAKY